MKLKQLDNDEMILRLMYEYRKLSNETLALEAVHLTEKFTETVTAQMNIMKLGKASVGILTALNKNSLDMMRKIAAYNLVINERRNQLN